MSTLKSSLAQIALIDLNFALAEIAGDDSDRINRVRYHLEQVGACLRIIAPEFMAEPADAEVHDAVSEAAA